MRFGNLLLHASAVVALPSIIDTRTHVLHEREVAPNGLQRAKRVDGESIVPFRIALKQTNLEHGYEYLMNISNPASSHYGKHWTSEEVRDAFRPSDESLAIVRNWLYSAGIQYLTEEKGWVEFETSIRHAEGMLMNRYYEHADDRNDGIRIGCQEYHLPKHVSKQVDYITPGVALSAPLRKTSVSRGNYFKLRPRWMRTVQSRPQRTKRESSAETPKNELEHCGKRMTPNCIRALYDIPDAQTIAQTYQSDPANTLGVFEFGSVYNQTDLNSFFNKYAPNVPNSTHPLLDSTAPASKALKIINRYSPAEANIDLDIMYSLIYPQTVTLYQFVTQPNILEKGVALSLANAIDHFLEGVDGSYCDKTKSSRDHCGEFSPARVTSISYGVGEIFIPPAQQIRQCQEMLKLSLQGHTIVVASGDWGVASQPLNRGVAGCIVAGNFNASVGTGNGPTRNGTVFSPGFPQNCPYVLSVGGTQLDLDATANDEERALHSHGGELNALVSPNEFSSSGGFSNYFSRPSYQESAVNSYFSQHDPGYPHYTFNGVGGAQNGTNFGANGGIYNRAGRGFPDVSANGKLKDYLDGTLSTTKGTSLSAPIWASILTLMNEKRSEAGKGPVGFVNPVLYAHPEVFHDITRGSNPGCATKGFKACEGWDPITGLGTPNYPKLLELFLSLP